MKFYLSFLSVLILQQSNGQEVELQGRYGASFLGAETIEFVGKDSFYFHGFYCLDGVKGKGRCEIRNNYLYLYFENKKPETEKNRPRSAFISKTLLVDSFVNFQLKMVDENDIPIAFGSVVIENVGTRKFEMSTDSSGSVVFILRVNSNPIIIRTTSIGIESGYLELENGYNYSVKLVHQKDSLIGQELNKGEILIYEIADLSEELITMRAAKTSGTFRTYRRIKSQAKQ